MSRLENFFSLADHPMLYKLYFSLKLPDRCFCEEFLKITEHLNNDDFTLAVNRLFLDISPKPRKWIKMNELLLSSRYPIYSKE